MRRNKHFAAGKILAQGQFICPEHVQSHGVPGTSEGCVGAAAKQRYEHLTKLVKFYEAE